MSRIRITVGGVTLRVRLRDTPTAQAIARILPFDSRARTWGEEVYFPAPIQLLREPDARDVVEAGEIAFWIEGNAVAIGYGPTPISHGSEIRLAAATNVWADAEDDVTALSGVPEGASVRVEAID